MVSYTKNTGIKKMVTGSESGTWGDSTNTNLDIIDEALGHGVYNFSSDADATLTIGEFDTGDPAGAMMLQITDTGVVLTTSRNVTLAPSDCTKLWIVHNDTLQGLTFKQGSAGSTVSVLAGSTRVIYADGGGAVNGNIIDAFAALQVGAITVSGAATLGSLTMSGNGNFADNDLSRANLKDISEEAYSIGSVSGATSVNLENGNYQYATITGSTTFSFTNPPASGDVGWLTLEVINGSTNVTWPGAVDWGDAGAPTLQTTGTDLFTFVTRDAGTTWYGTQGWTG